MTPSETASEMKKKLKGQYDNGLPCRCADVGWSTTCGASRHVRKPLDITLWVDKNGQQITHGCTLKYTNPSYPEKLQPLHIAQIMDGDCWVKPFGQRPHRCRGHGRHKGRWRSEVWEIVTPSSPLLP
jgi:hypothetical protein